MKDKKILIIDFDTNSLDTLSDFLKDEGFEVIKAKDGESGLEKFESEHPDLLILEPMIPKIHGFDLCKNIANDSGKETPIIFTTEFYGEEQCKREALKSPNLIAFFKKPYRKKEVLSSVLDLLKEKKKASPLKTKQPEKQSEPDDPIEKELLKQDFIPKPEPSKEKKKPDTSNNINKMLQDTLSEFGVGAEKKKSVRPEKVEREEVEKEEIQEKKTAEEEQVAPEPKEAEMIVEEEIEEEKEIKEEEIEEEIEEEEEEEEIEKEEVLQAKEKRKVKEEMEIKEETQAAEEVKTEEAVDEEELFRRSKSDLFTELHEEPKGFSFFLKPILENLRSKAKSLAKISALRVVLPLALAVLIAGGAAFYFLRPKKTETPPEEITTLSVPFSQRDSSQRQLAELPSSIQAEEKSQEEAAPETAEEKTIDKQIPEETTQAKAETQSPIKTEEKPLTESETTSAQKKAPPPPPVQTKPMLSESMNFLKIKETPQEEPQSTTAQTKEESSPLATEKQDKSLTSEADTAEKTYKTGDLVALNMVDTPPILIRRVQPKYPPIALSQKIEDQVLVNVLISETGEVTKTMIIRGEKERHGFNQATEEAVKQWRFRPAIKTGVKVKVWKPILITFKKK